ncbi:MAG: rhodanese-like domain-containing protein [Methylomonas sp.]
MTLKSSFFLILLLFTSALWAEAPAKSSGTTAIEPRTVTAEQLQALQQNDRALIVDIRTEPEWQATGIIPGSQKLQSFNGDGQFDEQKWLADLQKLKATPDQSVILVCRSGNRSRKVGEFLIQQGVPNVYHLNDGIQSWINSGHPVQNQR